MFFHLVQTFCLYSSKLSHVVMDFSVFHHSPVYVCALYIYLKLRDCVSLGFLRRPPINNTLLPTWSEYIEK